MRAHSSARHCCDGKGRAARVQCELLLAATFIVLCWICIVGKQQKDHKPQSLNYCFFTNQRVLFFMMPFLTWQRLCTNRPFEDYQLRMFVKQPNRRLHQLLAVENKTILQQLKPSTLYMMFQLTLIFYPHHTGMRSEMLYTNGSFEICQERMFVKQRRKNGWSSYLLPKKIFILNQK